MERSYESGRITPEEWLQIRHVVNEVVNAQLLVHRQQYQHMLPPITHCLSQFSVKGELIDCMEKRDHLGPHIWRYGDSAVLTWE